MYCVPIIPGINCALLFAGTPEKRRSAATSGVLTVPCYCRSRLPPAPDLRKLFHHIWVTGAIRQQITHLPAPLISPQQYTVFSLARVFVVLKRGPVSFEESRENPASL